MTTSWFFFGTNQRKRLFFCFVLFFGGGGGGQKSKRGEFSLLENFIKWAIVTYFINWSRLSCGLTTDRESNHRNFEPIQDWDNSGRGQRTLVRLPARDRLWDNEILATLRMRRNRDSRILPQNFTSFRTFSVLGFGLCMELETFHTWNISAGLYVLNKMRRLRPTLEKTRFWHLKNWQTMVQFCCCCTTMGFKYSPFLPRDDVKAGVISTGLSVHATTAIKCTSNLGSCSAMETSTPVSSRSDSSLKAFKLYCVPPEYKARQKPKDGIFIYHVPQGRWKENEFTTNL